VMFAPGNGFYLTKGMGEQEIRIAYVLKLESLKKAMECLKIALSQYPGRIK
jgi:aspartate aminotransferase